MGRPRKPTHLHIISGSAKEHPGRIRARALEPDVSGDLRDILAPFHLAPDLREIWETLRKVVAPGIAGKADLLAFEALVRLVATMRAGSATAALYARLNAMLGEFGMTPASRSKVMHLSAPKASRFAVLKGRAD